MRIEKISNQNFNGSLIYVTKDGLKHTKNIAKRLPYTYGGFKRSLQIALRNEPFDVFISRGETPLHFNIKAGDTDKLHTIPREVKLEPNPYKTYSASEYYKNPDDLEEAIYGAIEDYNIGRFEK